MKFLIWARSYDPDTGGMIVLHKLCHQLRKLGHSAYLQPPVRQDFARLRRLYHYAASNSSLLRRFTRSGMALNPHLDASMLPLGIDFRPGSTIAIYPEVVAGNPFGVSHVVRWFLHKPGFHTGLAEYGTGEFHVDFNQFLAGYVSSGNHVSPNKLYVPHYPLEIYNMQGAAPDEARRGAAYCIRKGQLLSGTDLQGAVCIDGLSHAEIAALFKRVRYFYSFDLYTAYSQFAALCGAIPIVLPPPGTAKDQWQVGESDRLGVAFGPDEVEWAVATRHLVLAALRV